MSYSTGILPFKYFVGGRNMAGSALIRAYGLTKNSPDFKIWEHGQKYDQLIFQKNYWTEMMRHFRGPKILDLCDPDWINGIVDIIETGSLVDAITCSSLRLTELIASYFPEKIVSYLPDRFDFTTFPEPRAPHKGKAKKAIWFGYISNAHETLPTLATALKKHGLALTIISEMPYSVDDEIKALQPFFKRYDHETAYTLIRDGDIILNPKSEKAFFKYKSNNKSVIGLKLGVPIAENNSNLERLIDPYERNKEIEEKIKEVEVNYDIARSIQQYNEIFDSIRKQQYII